MLRLPPFTYHRPATVADAVAIAAAHGDDAMYVAGGTDLYPNMKRRQQTPSHVVSLAGIEELHAIRGSAATGTTVGAMVTLTALERSAALREAHPWLVEAVRAVSTPLLRNMGTLGGNVLLDTRCTYYDQTYEWRESIHFCMKRDGPICWVAPSSSKCLAVQSSDTVPLLCAIGAEATLAGPDGERRLAFDDLYQDDGIDYTTRRRGELLVAVHLPPTGGWAACYRKLRRRGTFDFPVLGVGAWIRPDGEAVGEARVRLGGTASYPMVAEAAEAMLKGQRPTAELVAEAAATTFKPVHAMDNTDHEAAWRKKVTPVFVERALREALARAGLPVG